MGKLPSVMRPDARPAPGRVTLSRLTRSRCSAGTPHKTPRAPRRTIAVPFSGYDFGSCGETGGPRLACPRRRGWADRLHPGRAAKVGRPRREVSWSSRGSRSDGFRQLNAGRKTGCIDRRDALCRHEPRRSRGSHAAPVPAGVGRVGPVGWAADRRVRTSDRLGNRVPIPSLLRGYPFTAIGMKRGQNNPRPHEVHSVGPTRGPSPRPISTCRIQPSSFRRGHRRCHRHPRRQRHLSPRR
jgi:hypothetical protein